MRRKYQVVAGPHRIAKRYALSRGWADDEVIIVTRGHQLARLDPELITSIVTVQLHTLGARITAEIQEEIARVAALWPVLTQAAA